jgi:hypothetical protein
MAWSLARHAPTGDHMKLSLDQGHQLIESRFIACSPPEQERGHFRTLIRDALF